MSVPYGRCIFRVWFGGVTGLPPPLVWSVHFSCVVWGFSGVVWGLRCPDASFGVVWGFSGVAWR